MFSMSLAGVLTALLAWNGLAAALLLAVIAAVVGLVWRRLSGIEVGVAELLRLAQVERVTQTQINTALAAQVANLERNVRQDVSDSSRIARAELSQTLVQFQTALLEQTAQATRTQNAQMDAFAKQLTALQSHMADTLTNNFNAMSETNARRMGEVRTTLDTQLMQLQQGNAAKLDEMRAVVDEKLQATLHQRLGESFKQVADRLEQVHKGLGEMQVLAQGVGDLKHLLSNVKNRGMFGEAQLKSLLEEVMAPDQYAEQVMTKPGSRNLVDFAIRMPGRSDDGTPVWLPVDAKFPTEDYERLLEAQEQANPVAVAAATKDLAARIKSEAKSMSEKYVEPPYTTDFAVMFLPTESLYAEVLRVSGLLELLQREYRVTIVGPTTLMAMLNSLQMGFRTLALEKRSSEVWQVLGAVKTEFSKFGGVLAKVKSQTQTMLNTIDNAQARTRAMDRALRHVEALPTEQAQVVLNSDAAGDAFSDVSGDTSEPRAANGEQSVTRAPNLL
jgi:DNA recombination protein RmuC